ncbi:DUF6318 family protein [Kribbella swartbergensis]
MTNRNRPLQLLLLACLTTTLLPACTNSPEAGHPNTTATSAPTSTSGPDATASSPSSGSASTSASPQQPPIRPSGANGLSLAAAEAFIRYYSDVLNYASETGDTAPLLAASDGGCEGCKLYADYVKKANGKNGGLTGDYREKLTEVSELYRGTNGHIGASALVTIGAYVSKQTPTSKPVASKAAKYKREIALSPKNGNWIMFEMKLVEQ